MEAQLATEYPQRVLSLGAGVQSTTLLLMMLHDEIERPHHVVFADTGWEPQRVYDHLDYLSGLMDEAGIPFHKVSTGNIREDFFSDTKRYASPPLFLEQSNGKRSMVRRQCTAEYKVKPLMIKQREIAGLKPGQRCSEHRVTTILGISWDESQRMRDPQFSWIEHEYPLIDRRMTRQDCIQWCEDHGYKRPPRSACIGCPFKSTAEWRSTQEHPDEWQDAVDFDHQLRSSPVIQARYRGTAYLHASRQPLDEVDLRTDEELGILSLFDVECQGMCGI